PGSPAECGAGNPCLVWSWIEPAYGLRVGRLPARGAAAATRRGARGSPTSCRWSSGRCRGRSSGARSGLTSPPALRRPTRGGRWRARGRHRYGRPWRSTRSSAVQTWTSTGGQPGRYRRQSGQLRRQDAQEVFQEALADMAERATQAAPVDERTEHAKYAGYAGEPDVAIWFTLDPMPCVRELAERYVDHAGDRMHFWARSLMGAVAGLSLAPPGAR